jgi:hypothetical protein
VDDRPHQLSRRSTQTPRTLEGYVTASAPPRWMERLAQIDHGMAREARRLDEEYQRLRERYAGDPEGFARRWRTVAERWPFDEELNDLIRTHNEWFPVERRLPIDPRTRDYVPINGRSYRRPLLGTDWVLQRFPAAL